MELNQPYYIEKRKGENHINLNGKWDFCCLDFPEDKLCDINFEYSSDLPASVVRCLNNAGVYPDPYVGLNSHLYKWIDEKVWYFRKRFAVKAQNTDVNAFLCFDGVGYYTRVWINETLLGDHEGMFGGPVCDATQYINYDGENELIVEVKACNYGIKAEFDHHNKSGNNTQIVPWNIANDGLVFGGDLNVFGIWNDVRLEIVSKTHISRPYLHTVSANAQSAELSLELEIAAGKVKELHKYYGYNEETEVVTTKDYTFAYASGLTGSTLDEIVDIKTTIYDCDGQIVYTSMDSEKLLDYDNLKCNSDYYEQQFFCKSIEIQNPKLWYPRCFGTPYMYDVQIELYSNGKLMDSHSFKTGIRTFEAKRTKGRKYAARWGNYQFVINGKEFFLKGINWMPVDFLYSLEPKEYEWAIELIKNAGIQMIRVWNGGGFPEIDLFYDICDREGILVWQDTFIANVHDSHAYDQCALESQIAYNVYRIRNHPSLVIYCGGNEFAAYTCGNAASMFVTDRIIRDLDPSRLFYYTTPDKGSAHVYPGDVEPVWYRHNYKELPFFAETGLHCFPNFETIKSVVDEKECIGKLPDLTNPEFAKVLPELVHHFTEYTADNMKYKLARISHITDISDMTLENLCKASQMQAYEFYTVMIQTAEENYPVCGGIMPWVFKRPCPTAAIQLVDAYGRPNYNYYAMQNTYRDIGICYCQKWSILKPHETLPITVKIFNQGHYCLNDAKIRFTIYSPDLSLEKEWAFDYIDATNEYTLEDFKLTDKYTNKCFLASADLIINNDIAARTVYVHKCTDMLADEEFCAEYRKEPKRITFENGPYLMEDLKNAGAARLDVQIIDNGYEGSYRVYEVIIENISDVPAYPVTINIINKTARFFASDNYIMIKQNEVKKIKVTCDGLAEAEKAEIYVDWLNK